MGSFATRIERSILEDAIRFVLELAPLATAALADDDEPGVMGFGEPGAQ